MQPAGRLQSQLDVAILARVNACVCRLSRSQVAESRNGKAGAQIGQVHELSLRKILVAEESIQLTNRNRMNENVHSFRTLIFMKFRKFPDEIANYMNISIDCDIF